MAEKPVVEQPQFFSILESDFRTKLGIPRAFLKYIKSEKLEMATILNPLGMPWDVKVEGDSPNLYFGEGWSEFVQFHDLNLGYLLLFDYLGSMVFSLNVFDLSCCKKEYYYNKSDVGGSGVKNKKDATNLPQRETNPLDVPERTVKASFLIPNDDESSISLCLTLLANLMAGALTDKHALTYWISFLGNALPGFGDTILTCLDKSGFNIKRESFELWVEARGISTRVNRTNTNLENLVIWGLYLLLPYKNFTAENYLGFMSSRTKALSSYTGVDPKDISVPTSLPRAQYLRRTLGAVHELRYEIVANLIIARDQRIAGLSSVTAYVLRILEWTDMTAYTFIVDALVKSRSPVLSHPDLRGEAELLRRAMDAVNEMDYPQYFRIMAHPEAANLVDKNQFPTLFSIAYEILREIRVLPRQLIPVGNINREFVQEMVDLHKQYSSGVKEIPTGLLPYLPKFVDMDVLQESFNREFLSEEAKKRRNKRHREE